jgi:hypothetical protein
MRIQTEESTRGPRLGRYRHKIHRALAEATSIAAAAQVAPKAATSGAVKMVMDIEDPAYRTDRMLKAILLTGNELLGEHPDKFRRERLIDRRHSIAARDILQRNQISI